MILLIYLIMVFIHLVYIDIRMAFYRIFTSRAHLLKAAGREAFRGSSFILRHGRRMIGLELSQLITRTDIPDQCVIIANHQSLLDILVIIFSFPGRDVRFVAKKELGHFVPGASRVLRFGRHALIQRHSNLRQTGLLLKQLASRSLHHGWSPVIFPEGTRSSDGNMLSFHSGAYRIVQSSLKLPTLVLAIDGGSNFSHFRDFLHRNRYLYRIAVADLIPPPENKEQIEAHLVRARESISKTLATWRAQTRGSIRD